MILQLTLLFLLKSVYSRLQNLIPRTQLLLNVHKNKSAMQANLIVSIQKPFCLYELAHRHWHLYVRDMSV